MDNVTNLVNTTFGNLSHSTVDELDAISSALAPPLWGLLVVVGAIGNGLVIFTLVKHGEKSPTNCFIINLGVADLAFILIVLPFTILMFVTKSWELGEGTCKTFHYMTYVSILFTIQFDLLLKWDLFGVSFPGDLPDNT